MAIPVYCHNPACTNHHRPQRLNEAAAGRRIRCQVCGQALPVPAAEKSRLPLWGALALVAGLAVILLALLAMVLSFPAPEKNPLPEQTSFAGTLPHPFGDHFSEKWKEPEDKEKPPRAPLLVPPSGSSPAPKPALEMPLAVGKVSTLLPGQAEAKKGPAPLDFPAGPQKANPSPPEQARFILPFDAVGPVEKLDRIKVIRIQGKFLFPDSSSSNQTRLTWQSISRFKWEEKVGKVNIVFVIDGDRGWFSIDEKIKSMEPEGFSFYQNMAYSLSLSNLIPLREPGFAIQRGKDVWVRDRECFTAQVKARGRLEMLLFFDKKTGLLAKSEFRGRFYDFAHLKLQSSPTVLENYFSDYQKIHGLNHWKRHEQYRNGKKYCDFLLDGVQFLEEVEERWFSLAREAGPALPAASGPGPKNPGDKRLPPAPPSSWQITRIIQGSNKTALKNAQSLRLTLMFSRPTGEQEPGRFRLVDRQGFTLDETTLRLSTNPARYGLLIFAEIQKGRSQALESLGLFLEDEQGYRAPLEIGAVSRKTLQATAH